MTSWRSNQPEGSMGCEGGRPGICPPPPGIIWASALFDPSAAAPAITAKQLTIIRRMVPSGGY